MQNPRPAPIGPQLVRGTCAIERKLDGGKVMTSYKSNIAEYSLAISEQLLLCILAFSSWLNCVVHFQHLTIYYTCIVQSRPQLSQLLSLLKIFDKYLVTSVTFFLNLQEDTRGRFGIPSSCRNLWPNTHIQSSAWAAGSSASRSLAVLQFYRYLKADSFNAMSLSTAEWSQKAMLRHTILINSLKIWTRMGVLKDLGNCPSNPYFIAFFAASGPSSGAKVDLAALSSF